MQIIERNGKLLLNLINDILDLSKIEAGKMTLSPERFDVCGVARDVVATLQPLVNQKELTLKGPDDAMSILITADPFKTKQILTNLVANAIKFTPKSGGIAVKVGLLREIVTITVSDNGPGIAPADHARVFKEFVQLDEARGGGQTGTG